MQKVRFGTEVRSSYLCFKVVTTSHQMALWADDDFEKRHHCLVGHVFAAFTFEAMLNHYGRIIFDDWNSISDQRTDRKSWHQKFFKKVDLPFYLGNKPYQTLRRCFFTRDALAHGHTDDEVGELCTEHTDSETELLRKVLTVPRGQEKNATVESLKSAIDALRQFQNDIEANGYYPSPEGLS